MKNAIGAADEVAGKTLTRAKRKNTKAAIVRRVREDFKNVIAGVACKRVAGRASLTEGPFISVDASASWKDDLTWATREVRKRFRVPESVLSNNAYERKIPLRSYVQEIKEMATAWHYKSSTLIARTLLANHNRNWREAEQGFKELKKLILVSGDWDWFVVSFSVFLSQAYGDIIDSPNPTLERFGWIPHGPQRSGKTKFNEVVITEMYGKDNRTSAVNWIKDGFTTPAKLFPMGRSDEMSWRTKEQFDMFKDETTSVSDRYVNLKYVPEFVAKMRHSHLTTTNYDYAEIVTRFGPQRRIISFRFERREDIPNYEELLRKAIRRICRAHTEEYFFDPGKVSEYNLIRESSILGSPFHRLVSVWSNSEEFDGDVYLYNDEDTYYKFHRELPSILLSRNNIHLKEGRVLEGMPLEDDYDKYGFTKHKVYIWLTERFAFEVKNLTEEVVEHRGIQKENVLRFLNRYCISRYSKKGNAIRWFLRKDWKERLKQGECVELPEVIDPETVRRSPTAVKWAGLSEDALVDGMVREECAKLFNTVAPLLEGTDYRALADMRKESKLNALSVAQSYYKGHVVTGREEEDLSKICNYLNWLMERYQMFNTGNSWIKVDVAVAQIKEVVSYNVELVKLVDRCMTGKEPSVAKKLTLQYIGGGNNPGRVHGDTARVAGYLLRLKQSGKPLILKGGSQMSLPVAVERVRETLSYDAGHLDLFNRVYGGEKTDCKKLYEILDKPHPPKKIAFNSDKRPIGAWGNDQETKPEEISSAAGWGYNLEGSPFVVIDTDSEEARAALISRFPRVEETLKTINSNKKGSCHYWLTTNHRLPRKYFNGYDLLGNAVNSATCENGRLYMLGDNPIEHIDTVLKTPDMLKSVYEVFGTDNPAEVMCRIETMKC